MSKNPKIRLVQEQEITFQELFEQFQIYNKARNLAQATLNFYQQTYKSITKFMNGNFILSLFDEQKLCEYIIHLREDNGNGDIAINSQLRALRTMVNFGVERGYMEPLTIKMIKADDPVMETYSEEELKILLRRPKMDTANFAEYRNWVLTNFFLGTGARTSTVCSIRIKDLDMSAGEVIFRHMKARKQIVVPLSSTLKGILIQYLKYRKGNPDDYLFCDQRGGMMSPNTLKFAIKRYNLRRGVMRTSIHAYRHTFAKLYITNGGNPFILQRLLGHADIKMTMRYVHLFSKDLAKDYDTFNPLEALTDKKQYIKLK